MDWLETVLFFLTVVGGYTISGLIGFGANVLTVPILSLFFPVQELVVVLAVISFTNAAYRVVENRAGILWGEFGRMLLLSLPGTVLGLWILKNLPEHWLKLVLGCFVIAIAGRQLWQRWHSGARQQEPQAAVEQQAPQEGGRSSWFYRAVLFTGGVVQGAFVCGGPLYLIYCSHYYMHDRRQFRGMQFGILFVNSTIIVLSYVLRDAYSQALLLDSALGLAALAVAVLVSNACLKRINDDTLRYLVQLILLLAGLSLVVQSTIRLMGL